MKLQKAMIAPLRRLRDSRPLWETMGEIYNRRIYSAISELYNYAADALPTQAKMRVLDVGCGRGYVALKIAQKNPDAQVAGIDFSARQTRAARKQQKIQDITNCRFERGNVLNIRFANDSFDAAVSVGSAKHWPDPVRGLLEIRRVLKPGGWLLISETDQDVSDDDLRRFMTRFQVWFLPRRLLFWGLRQLIFGQSFSQASLEQAIAQAGFQSIEGLRLPDCPYIITRARKQGQKSGD